MKYLVYCKNKYRPEIYKPIYFTGFHNNGDLLKKFATLLDTKIEADKACNYLYDIHAGFEICYVEQVR